jgi:mono/diheme cytochrome c family protein
VIVRGKALPEISAPARVIFVPHTLAGATPPAHARRKVFMRRTAAVSSVAVIVMLVAAVQMSFSAPPPPASQLARGKYIVEGVAMCGECHSMLDDKGKPIPGREYKGATLTFKPIEPMPIWADKAPNIAGLRGWDGEDAVKFLMTGLAYNDLPARPPMPPYRMNKEDAEAVVAYLKSLSPARK